MTVAVESLALREATAQEALAAQAQLTREDMLEELFPYDLEYARESGLLDMFYYNPETGSDGLVHVLGGEVKMSNAGVPLPSGFHHEPSVAAIWGEPDADGQYPTRIRLESGNPHPADNFPMAPYAGQVVIGGIEKRIVRHNKQGELLIIPAENTFFPREYDALAVLQGIRHAYDNRDTRREQLFIPPYHVPRYVSFGPMPLIDGREVPLKLVIEFESDKIISAMPKPPADFADQPQLTQAEMWQHIATPHTKAVQQ